MVTVHGWHVGAASSGATGSGVYCHQQHAGATHAPAAVCASHVHVPGVPAGSERGPTIRAAV